MYPQIRILSSEFGINDVVSGRISNLVYSTFFMGVTAEVKRNRNRLFFVLIDIFTGDPGITVMACNRLAYKDQKKLGNSVGPSVNRIAANTNGDGKSKQKIITKKINQYIRFGGPGGGGGVERLWRFY